MDQEALGRTGHSQARGSVGGGSAARTLSLTLPVGRFGIFALRYTRRMQGRWLVHGGALVAGRPEFSCLATVGGHFRVLPGQLPLASCPVFPVLSQRGGARVGSRRTPANVVLIASTPQGPLGHRPCSPRRHGTRYPSGPSQHGLP